MQVWCRTSAYYRKKFNWSQRNNQFLGSGQIALDVSWMAHRSTMAGSCICILLEVEEKPPTPNSRAIKETAESIPFQLLWSYRCALQEGNQPSIEAGYLGRVLLRMPPLDAASQEHPNSKSTDAWYTDQGHRATLVVPLTPVVLACNSSTVATACAFQATGSPASQRWLRKNDTRPWAPA